MNATRYGVYRDRARTAVLTTITLDSQTACQQANALAGQNGGSYSAWVAVDGTLPEILTLGASTGPRCLQRWSHTPLLSSQS